MTELDQARAEIEQIDRQMAELFQKRMKCSKMVAEYKIERGLPVLDKNREKILIEKNAGYITDPIIEPYYRALFGAVLEESKKFQHRLMEGLRVAYSGIEGSFASISTSRIFPDAQRIPYMNFAEAYDAVEKGECDLAVLPIENSYAGEVSQVTELMFDGNLFINGVYELGVSQCLLGVKGATTETITTVISHPQALAQCADFIKNHGYKQIQADNTARAAKEVSDKNDISVAAIASKENADLYGLEVIDHDINESAQNTTRFAVFAKSKDAMKHNDEYSTFILMFTVRNEAGTLAKAISILGDYGYSMRVIRSRPQKDKNWQYYFYAEVEGKLESEIGNRMLTDLRKECELLKVIGSYKPNEKI